MFNSKIKTKLSLYFTTALLVFAVIIGSVFIVLFKNYSLDINRQDLERRATSIASTIPNYLDNQGSGIKGFGMYLNVISDIQDKDVWIVDGNLNLITSKGRHNQSHMDYEFKDLPDNAEALVSEVMKGKTEFSEEFSNLLDNQTLTVGVPILNNEQTVIGVVLLHSPIFGVNETIVQGMSILSFSILLALVVAVALAIILSRHFTKPLIKINKSALSLLDHNYDTKTDVHQNDEIGQLALTLDSLAIRLDHASKESKRLEKMRQEFISNISHELKTPVTVMRGSLEALVDKVVSDPDLVEDYYYQMLNEAKFLDRLINDLLELSKLQSLDFTMHKENLSMIEVIDDLLRTVDNMAKNKNIKIELIKNTDDIEVFGDYGRIRQMFMTILDNAVKFSHQGGKVEIIMEDDKIIIKDEGVGISTAELPYIFERFKKSRSEENKVGTGLGLPIAFNIAKRHDIEIIAKSIENKGSSFTFLIKHKKTNELT